MFHPKKTKYNKTFRGKIFGVETKVIRLTFGTIGIKILKTARIKECQLDALQKILVKKIKGKGKIWFKIFPNLAVSAKPAEIRMGKGKGNFSYWCACINAGRIIIEFQSLELNFCTEIAKICSYKLGLPIKLIFL